jgi:hypothetical protein
MEDRSIPKGIPLTTQNKPSSKREPKQAQSSTNTLKADT